MSPIYPIFYLLKWDYKTPGTYELMRARHRQSSHVHSPLTESKLHIHPPVGEVSKRTRARQPQRRLVQRLRDKGFLGFRV